MGYLIIEDINEDNNISTTTKKKKKLQDHV